MTAAITSLERLVRTLDADLPRDFGRGTSAQLIRVRVDGEVALRSLDGEHPFDALLGFVTPEDWLIIGVIAPADALRVDDDGNEVECRARVVHVCARTGEQVSLLRFDDVDDVSITIPNGGRVSDCLRRSFGLDTEPVDDMALNVVNVSRILVDVAASPERVTPRNVDIFMSASTRSTWSEERWHAIEHGNEVMDGTVAAWLDEGMFARMMLAALPDHDELMISAKARCDSAAWTTLLSFMITTAIEP